MRTLGDLNYDTNWRERKPAYDNLSDTRMMEYNIVAEVDDVKKELQELVNLSDKIHSQIIGGLQQGGITEWEQIAEILSNWANEMEEKMEIITDRFY